MRHRRQPGAELAGGDPGHGAAEPFPPHPATHRFAAGRAGIGEVEVLHHHRRTAVMVGVIEQRGDRRPDPAIPTGCGQTRRLDGNRERRPDRVPRPVDQAAGEVIGVQIDPQHRSDTQLLDRRRDGDVVGPGGVQIPAVLGRVVADVVAHRSAPPDPLGPLTAAMHETHRCRDLQVRPELLS